jgi:hypothetical protein
VPISLLIFFYEYRVCLYLQLFVWGSCLIYVICVCLVCLYLQLFVWGSCLKTNQTNTNNVNKTWASYKQLEVKTNQTNTNNVNKTCASYKQLEVKTNQTNTNNDVICVCLVCLYLQLFVWGSCLIYVICVCLVCLYLQLFVWGACLIHLAWDA